MTYEQAMHFWFDRVNYEVKSPRPSDLRTCAMLSAIWSVWPMKSNVRATKFCI